MKNSAPITWIIDQINDVVTAGASTVASAIAHGIAPVVSACFGIYVMLIVIGYMRGTQSEPVTDFMMRLVAWSLIIGLGLNASNYVSVVSPIVTGLGGDLANLVSGGNDTANTLDQLALTYLKIISDGFDAAGNITSLSAFGTNLLVFLKAVIIILGLVPFLVAAAATIISANVGSTIIAMIGPLFFAALLFPATRQYFSAWLNSALSFALIPFLIAVIANISISLSASMIGTGNLKSASFETVYLASIGNLILLYLLKQVSSLASSLSAGGINMGPVGGLGSLASKVMGSYMGTSNQMRTMGKDVKDGIKLGKAAYSYLSNSSNSIRKAG